MESSSRNLRDRSSRAASSPGSSSAINYDLALDVLRRWGKIVIPVGLLLAVAAGVAAYVTFTPKYQARVLVWIAQNETFLVQPDAYSERNFVQNQLGFIRSSLVLGPAVSRPEVATLPELAESQLEPIDTLRNLVSVDRAWGTENYYIACTSPNPTSAKDIANAVADSYLELLSAYEAGRTKRLIELLDEEREVSEREVERLRDNFRQMAIEQTGQDPYAANLSYRKDELPTRQLAALQSQLTGVKVEQSMLRSQISALEEYTAKHPIEVTDSMAEQALDKNERLQRQRVLIAEKRMRLAGIKTAAALGDKSPQYVALSDEIQRDEQNLASQRREMRPQTKIDLQAELARRQQDKLMLWKVQLDEFAARETALTKAYEEELKKVKQYSGESLALEVKRGELERALAVMDRISQRAFTLRTEQRAPARVELLEKATIPSRPVEAVPYKRIGMASAAVFVVPYLLAFLWELRSRRISSAEQLERHTALAIVGEIANLPLRAGRSSYFGGRGPGRQKQLFEESVESLRTCLLLTKSLSDAQILAVASAATQEGKTTLATQLAISLARSSAGSVLLVDGDMRAPKLHNIFELDSQFGLADVLAGRCTLDEAIVTDCGDLLHILPAGHLQGSPHKLVANGSLEPLMNVLRQRYRHVVFDTPPVLATGESLVMAAAADVTLVCTRRDVSREDQVRKACRRLEEAGANIVGGVFSGIPLRRYAYRYGYGYNYGVYVSGEEKTEDT
jgi:polysaccharide biosynthesis transport protein